MAHHKYNLEFRQNAVRLAGDPGKTDRSVEISLGLYQGAVRAWRKELAAHSDDAFPGSGRLHAKDDEIRRLKRDLADARMERDILKKAVAIFSVEPKRNSDS